MPGLAAIPLARRPDLVVRDLGDGRHVVKDPHTGAFYHLGEEEYFLLDRLDGRQTVEELCTAFAERFGQPLAPEELDEFVEMARSLGLLQAAEESPSAAGDERPRQSLLAWRMSLFDPDRLFTRLAPRLSFLWTRTFLVVSAVAVVLAGVLAWANRKELLASAASGLRWQTLALVWLTVAVVTALHECAHGLTCKHHGGEVREVGVLLLFFVPCFYCNVSDAWLFREKSKRLWVTLAGGYCDLCLWALAVFAWRLTPPGGAANSLAWVVLAVCGGRVLFNFNPLLKLDGYYLLSDWLEVPNLRQRSQDHVMGWLRALLWGAPRPAAEPRGRLLLVFGLASWLYSVLFLGVMLWALFRVLGGWAGAAVAVGLGWVSARGVFGGLAAGEVRQMIGKRGKRTVLWLSGLGALVLVLCLVEVEDRVGGPFRLRPARRAELRAPVAGLLREVACEQGDRVSTGTLVVRLEVPGLESRLAGKQAEVRETRAGLRLLEAGSRPEEIAEQRGRVERAAAWSDLARQDLKRTRQAFDEDDARLVKQIAAARAERDAARDGLARSRALASREVLTREEQERAEARDRIAEARLAEAEAARRSHRARGTLEAEGEVARRDKELADARGGLRLLEAGPRAEELEAARARLARQLEEVKDLEDQRRRQEVFAPVDGLVTTARLREKVGQYLREGDLICVVEEPAVLEAEVTLAEEDAARVCAGQAVRLKARALPFDSLSTRVERVAPAVSRGEGAGGVTVCCRLDDPPAGLLPEMTGHARIDTGRRSLGEVVLGGALRLLRTEFWW